MGNAQLKQVIEKELLQETQFFEGPHDAEQKVLKKIVRPHLERLLTIISLVSPLVREISNSSTMVRGLEVGTGYGGLIRSLARIFPEFKWYGLEHPDRQYLKKGAYWRLLEQSNCSLSLCDIVREKFPFEGEFFNLITFSEVLEHLPPEAVLPILKEIWRVLDKGGYLIISSPNQAGLLNRVQLLRGKSILSFPITVKYASGTFGHIRLYTPEELVTIASSVGFKVQQIVCKSWFLKYMEGTAFWKTVAYNLLWMFEILSRLLTDRLADTWYAVCQKPR